VVYVSGAPAPFPLDSKAFRERILDLEDGWLVWFKKSEEEENEAFEAAAAKCEGTIHPGYVECSTETELCAKYAPKGKSSWMLWCMQAPVQKRFTYL